MEHSKSYVHKTIRKSKSKIMRVKSLETDEAKDGSCAVVTPRIYGKKELHRSKNVGSSVESSRATTNSRPNTRNLEGSTDPDIRPVLKELDRSTIVGSCEVNEISQSTNSRPKSQNSEGSTDPSVGPMRDESYEFNYELHEIVPSRYMSSVTELQTSGDERNILAMPVHLKQGGINKNYQTKDDVKMQRNLKERSYIVQKENYIFSKQVRLPQDIIQEGVSRIESMNQYKSKIPSAVEVVDNLKTIRASTICFFLLVLIVPLTACIWTFFVKPIARTSPRKNVSLLRCFLEYLYDAMLDIYQ
uniref:Gigaxonin n=1 Tax=Lygus hesperus TaxID=30085 RepID=A0A0A9YG43_LYGHE